MVSTGTLIFAVIAAFVLGALAAAAITQFGYGLLRKQEAERLRRTGTVTVHLSPQHHGLLRAHLELWRDTTSDEDIRSEVCGLLDACTKPEGLISAEADRCYTEYAKSLGVDEGDYWLSLSTEELAFLGACLREAPRDLNSLLYEGSAAWLKDTPTNLRSLADGIGHKLPSARQGPVTLPDRDWTGFIYSYDRYTTDFAIFGRLRRDVDYVNRHAESIGSDHA